MVSLIKPGAGLNGEEVDRWVTNAGGAISLEKRGATNDARLISIVIDRIAR
ncbi:hypothetical protein QA641_00495 [Bradyrhizobium sp. CB1650]|uniref:hypothetical protein n=1 Tax=Bradyrhizobium sp. CB1650 TaxID=3039153 RepID=UPI0024351CB8|nr:hypothetical protein [Bradyrhizobium sp. CB1650]WGD52469.1 hypothetical protein QA641_00495 [Bradyrhizobium sp. CB1650]